MINFSVIVSNIQVVYDIISINLKKEKRISELRKQLNQKNEENEKLMRERQQMESLKMLKEKLLRENQKLIEEKAEIENQRRVQMEEYESAQRQKACEIKHYMEEIKRMRLKQNKMENHIKTKQNALKLKQQSLQKKKKKNKKLMQIIKQTNHEKDQHLGNLQREIAANKSEMEYQQEIVSKLSDEMKKDERLLNELKTQIRSEQMEKNKIEIEKKQILVNSEALDAKMKALDERYKKDIDLLKYELKHKKILAGDQIISDYVDEIQPEVEVEREFVFVYHEKVVA